MTREYNHDDVCRGTADGCDCSVTYRRCDVCGRTYGLMGTPPLCEGCRAQMAAEGYEPCLHCGVLCEGPLCSRECEDVERAERMVA